MAEKLQQERVNELYRRNVGQDQIERARKLRKDNEALIRETQRLIEESQAVVERISRTHDRIQSRSIQNALYDE